MTKENKNLALRWQKLVRCGGGTIVSYFKNNKPGNCHYTPPSSYFFFSEQTRNCYFKWALSKISRWSWLIKLHKIHNMQNHIRTLEHSREWQKFHTFLSVGNIKNYFLRMCWNFISWSLCRLKISSADIRTEKFNRMIKLYSSLFVGNIKTYFLRMCWNLILRSL